MLMKKNILLVVFACCVTCLSAQDFTQSLGVQIGYAQPTLRENIGYQFAPQAVTEFKGFKIGLVYDATLIKGFGYTIGLNYTVGADATDWTSNSPVYTYPQTRYKYIYHSLEIPIDWQYKFKVAENTWVILYTGPAFQWQMSISENQYTRQANDKEEKTGINLCDKEESGDRALKQWNLTWGVGAGFQFDRYYIRGGYDFGLINNYKNNYYHKSDDETHAIFSRMDGWNIKVGVYFLRF